MRPLGAPPRGLTGNEREQEAPPDTDRDRFWERHDAVVQPPVPQEQPPFSRGYGLAIGLFLITVFTTTTLGSLWTRIETLESMIWLSPYWIREVWTDPDQIAAGLRFSLPALFILLAHELGHYWVCRWHNLRVVAPRFLPAPVGFGTFGAFIRIREPIRSRRVLFDVGISGPIAGFVALLPFLFLGILWSEPAAPIASDGGPQIALGGNFALYLVAKWTHGGLPATGLELHPFAVAAWLGMLATMLNLLPVGQLDGGHIVYALFGKRQRRAAPFVWLALVAAAVIFGWWGWIVWAVLIAILGIRHPPTGDEHLPLDPMRRRLGWLALALFLLCLIPNPIGIVQ